eukprot:CAMPEP_0180713190 /NCGR_PEP_ID=MMETSP1038_2-20121128/11760_1 /TAXON_ID=632150 /ORGANISM="Azadinium spinosum, Strain 3D9" /LENGTH=162 /DNA_ID=CAMNT_0022745479 /DNA_START=66 /DNA_END=550 /DNA_ORIENTATION=-
MTHSSRMTFQAALLDSFETVQTSLSNVDIAQSEAFHEADREMIHGEIQRNIGFTKMNELTQTRVKEWLEDVAKSLLWKITLEEAEMADQEAILQRMQLQGNLARFVRENGKLEDAESYFRGLVKDADGIFGENQEALECHRACLTRRREMFGEDNEDVLQSA